MFIQEAIIEERCKDPLSTKKAYRRVEPQCRKPTHIIGSRTFVCRAYFPTFRIFFL